MRKLFSFRLDDKLILKIDHLAKHKELSRTAIIERAIELYWHDFKYDLHQLNLK